MSTFGPLVIDPGAYTKKRRHEMILDGEAKITDLDGSVPNSDNQVKTGIHNHYEAQKTSDKTRAIGKRLKAQEARLKTAELVLEFVKKESDIVLATGGTKEEKDAVNKLQSDLQEYVKFEQGNVEFQKSQEKKSPFLDFCKKVNKYFNFKPETFVKF